MDAYVVDACRTPRGRRKGSLAGVHPVDLCIAPMAAMVERTGIDPRHIEDVVIGCVTETDEQGACVARSAVLAAGWPVEVPGVTLNRSGSGQTAVNLARRRRRRARRRLRWRRGELTRVPMGADMGAISSLMNKYDLVPQGLAAEMVAERWKYTPAGRRVRAREPAPRVGRDQTGASRRASSR
jgi:acetyl-CoA acetyltransferase